MELGTGACFAVMALRFGPSPVLPAFLLLAALAPVLTLTDLRWRRLPDPLTLPAVPGRRGCCWRRARWPSRAPPGTSCPPWLSLAAAWLFFALLVLIHPAASAGAM